FAAFSITLLVILLVLSARLESPFEDVANPIPARWPDAVGFLRGPVWLAVFASLFVGVAAARSRYRSPEGIERLQMLWLAFGPLRRRAQAAVDWRFDRPRYDGLQRVRAFVDDVREGRGEPEGVGAVLAAALRDPSAELLFRLPASEAYADAVSGVVGDPPVD